MPLIDEKVEGFRRARRDLAQLKERQLILQNTLAVTTADLEVVSTQINQLVEELTRIGAELKREL